MRWDLDLNPIAHSPAWDDFEWLPLSGCGTQHPHRALGGTRVLLAAAPTTPPCFHHWWRSSLLHSSHFQRKFFLIRDSETPAGVSESPFHGWGREGQQHLQRRFLRKRGAAGYVPFREKATLENPQIFQSCKHKNILSAIYAQSERGAHSKSFFLQLTHKAPEGVSLGGFAML